MNSFFLRALNRIRMTLQNLWRKVESTFKFATSRTEAKVLIKETVKRNGRSVVADEKLKSEIKRYCKKRYGSSRYWPWIALYTEMRGEFRKGWVPYDHYRFNILPKWNQVSELSLNKTYDHQLFKDFALKPIVLIINGQFYNSDFRHISNAEAEKTITEYDTEIVIKRDLERGGKNIRFIHTSEIELSKLDFKANYLIQPSVRQHRLLAEFSPSSVNTLRVVTFLDRKGTCNVLFVNLRHGRKGSRIDNTSAGGVLLKVGLDGAVVSNAFDDNGVDRGANHPDAGFYYRDKYIPSVGEAVKKCVKSHHKFPYTRIVAWDVFINEDGTPGLIEWNARSPGIWVNEALFGPLWSEEEIDGVIDNR